MMHLKQYRNLLDHRRNDLMADLAAFESGHFRIATRRPPATEWKDQTEAMIEHYKQQIESYERMIALLDDRDASWNEIKMIGSSQRGYRIRL